MRRWRKPSKPCVSSIAKDSPLQQVSIIGHDADRELVGSKNQTGLGLCREHGIVWGRMVAIGQITLANTYDGPCVAVVIEIKELHRHSACGCLPNNASLRDVPDKVFRPPIAAGVKE
jgi:hypothetical protein